MIVWFNKSGLSEAKIQADFVKRATCLFYNKHDWKQAVRCGDYSQMR
jgi:hypothetical protein